MPVLRKKYNNSRVDVHGGIFNLCRSLNPSIQDSAGSMNTIKTMDQFWKFADESKLNAQYLADKKIRFLKKASLDDVKKVCIQYRYFVERYPDNLALLVRRLPYGSLKSILAEILSQELGSGNVQNCHVMLYDRFLRSIGVTQSEICCSLYTENREIFQEIEKRCSNFPHQHVVGLVGMGGECLCQIYLTNMYKYLIQNESMKEIGDTVDWQFWTYHVGDEDIRHRELVREAINAQGLDASGIQELAIGYWWGKCKWDRFWDNNYKETLVSPFHE